VADASGTETGYWRLVHPDWPLATGSSDWPLATGSSDWLLATGSSALRLRGHVICEAASYAYHRSAHRTARPRGGGRARAVSRHQPLSRSARERAWARSVRTIPQEGTDRARQYLPVERTRAG